MTQHLKGLDAPADFAERHIGPSEADVAEMLATLGYSSLDELIEATLPADIRSHRPLDLPAPLNEHDATHRLRAIVAQNRVARSMIGMGYHGTITPAVIQRCIIENPLWYTPYTPYQAEIAQGRLEALLNFQTMVADLTGLPLANASLLDEATAAAEAMAMCYAIGRGKKPAFLVSDDCHPQTLAVVRTRAESIGIELEIADLSSLASVGDNYCGILLQYPTTDGRVEDYSALVAAAHRAGALVVMAADILSLVLLRSPGEIGADIAIGSTQRFGVPMGFGGPHAAYLATHEAHVRRMPGRLVGVSQDAQGRPAYRLAIQTREQHIRRDKATSNICTAQVLLAIVASMYAVYHGPEGLHRIARRVHRMARVVAAGLRQLGLAVGDGVFFDTVSVDVGNDAERLLEQAAAAGLNLRALGNGRLAINVDETTSSRDLRELLAVFAGDRTLPALEDLQAEIGDDIPPPHARGGEILQHPIFREHHSEHELLRYITRLQNRDVSLANSMIPLGSCTMKLNSAAEMMPITWPEIAHIHPFAPADQTRGYQQIIEELSAWLREITGFAAVSMQPNAGSQGEYAGLLAIRRYHISRAEAHRDVCLIPVSAHGTNPASAVIAGMRVVAVACRPNGDVDVDDLRAKAKEHADRLSALMITYPSTHGVFEAQVREVCRIVHQHGGQVYMDGANMNAQVGLCRPGDIGADVCHLNLHKTFCIPHGGGGPGMGPIGVAAHLAEFLPGHPLLGDGVVSAATHGSPMILPIPWMYIQMMGGAGLTRATQVAILNANYMAKRLSGHFDVLFTGTDGRVAHEFIVDCRGFEKSAGITVEDIAKRLMDFGFHAPTMSFPVAGTLMIEPTESESRAELDRFCDALILIRNEIQAIADGQLDRTDNPLKNAPHTAAAIGSDEWPHRYSRERAAYPAPWLREAKYWPPVGRIDNAYGDRNLICTCPPIEAYSQE
ncbi:MAG TPA: aminomethyl-transferring glycine dehydrogenase [Terriglobales bacterium]|nr:aminomethyl-transferring glycine dehydrogenase [Terriglobales bacterium]